MGLIGIGKEGSRVWEYDDPVKRASVILTVLLLSGAMFAQLHGVPASVTSFGPGRSMTPGIPASVTSLGRVGGNIPCSQPGCNNAFFLYPFGSSPSSIAHPHSGGHHHHPVRGTSYAGYYGGYAYVPYAYPVAVPVAVAPDDDAQVETEQDPPAPTVFERRPVVQLAPYTSTDQGAAEQHPQGQHVNLSPVSEEKIPVVVVFKDGHQQEIANGNYAIVGDMLYDLSGPIAHKIKLADLDLAQTVQLNEQRGVEFSLPAAYKPQA